jgi:transcriptional regulator with XRE-family HTH domain
MSLKSYIKGLLKQRGMTQQDLAHAIGVSKMTVSRWVSDESTESTILPDLPNLAATARVLEAPLARFIEEAGFNLGIEAVNTDSKLARQIVDRPALRRVVELMIEMDDNDLGFVEGMIIARKR